MHDPDISAEHSTPEMHRHETAGTAGDRIVETLIANGIDTVYGIPGVQTYELFEALARRQDEIRLVGARHEQGCGYMAFGHAQSTGRAACFSAVPGPGILNASAALLTALANNAPVIGLTSEIPTHFMGRGLGHVHEMPDQLATLRTVTKWAENVIDPLQAGPTVEEAFRQALSGRQGPAVVATPWDVLGQDGGVAGGRAKPLPAPTADEAALDAAVALLRDAKNPMLLVGGGARDARDEVRQIAELLQAPVAAFRNGRGVLDEDHPLSMTCAEGFEPWREADVVLAVGTRQELVWFRWPDRNPDLQVINVDIDPRQAERLEADVAITADATDALRSLLSRLAAADPRASRLDEYAKVKQEVRQEMADYLQPHVDHLAAIRAALPRDGFLVEEVSQVGFASTFAFPIHDPRRFITGGHQSNLGYGFPTALGVKVANPDRDVISLNGDGGFMFAVQELATAVAERIGTINVVFDNSAFGNVKADQERIFGRPHGSTLANPDFVAMAKSFGAEGVRVDDSDKLEQAVRQASGRDIPTVIHVPMPLQPEVTPWRYLAPQSRQENRPQE